MKPSRPTLRLLAFACACGLVSYGATAWAAQQLHEDGPAAAPQLVLPAAAPTHAEGSARARSFRTHDQIVAAMQPTPVAADPPPTTSPAGASASISVQATVLPSRVVTFKQGEAVRLQSNTADADARQSVWVAVDSRGHSLTWTAKRWGALRAAHPPRGMGDYAL